MNKLKPALLIALLGLSPTAALGADQETGDSEPDRRIVRVISRSGDAPIIDVGERVHVFNFSVAGHGENLLTGMSRTRGYLGVQTLELTSELRRHFGAEADAGVMISAVAANSPALETGLEVGDVITAVDRKPVASSVGLAREISGLDAGSVVELDVVRDGTRRVIPVTVVERERRVVDIGRLAFTDPEQLDELSWVAGEKVRHILEIDETGLREALSDLESRFSESGLTERLKVLGVGQPDLHERIRELETRLEELERQLDRLPEP